MTIRRSLRSLRSLLVVTCCACLPAASACDLINTPTKMGNGQLYESGDGKYDPYLASVHEQQIAAAKWPDESKAARRPIITALNLLPGASNALIVAAAREAREKKGDASLAPAVDETVNLERDFSKRLGAAASNLDDLLKRGEGLRKDAIAERKDMAADKADDKKVAKKEELKREMSASVDAIETMLSDARHGAKEADDLASRLRGAWSGKDEPSKDDKSDKKDDKADKKDDKADKSDKKDDKKKPDAAKPEPKKPSPKPEERPEAAPKKPPPPKPEEKPEPKAATPKPSDEVFNP